MKILWIVLSLVVIIIGALFVMDAGAQADGQLQSNLRAAMIGQIFGLPIIVVGISACIKKHRNVASLFKAFSIAGLIMLVVAIAGR